MGNWWGTGGQLVPFPTMMATVRFGFPESGAEGLDLGSEFGVSDYDGGGQVWFSRERSRGFDFGSDIFGSRLLVT